MNRMMIGVLRCVLSVIVCACWLTPVHAESKASPDELFAQAQKQDAAGGYTAARGLYRSAWSGFMGARRTNEADRCRRRINELDGIMVEFPLDSAAVHSSLTNMFPSVPSAKVKSWVNDAVLDCMEYDGARRFFSGFANNMRFRNRELMWMDPAAQKREAGFYERVKGVLNPSPSDVVGSRNWKSFVNPVSYLVVERLSVRRQDLPGDGILKVWVPLALQTPSQDGIEIVSIEPAGNLEGRPRTDGDIAVACFRFDLAKLESDLDVKIRLVFSHSEQRFHIDPERVRDYDRGSLEYLKYTGSGKNINVSAAIWQKAAEVVGEEKNPYLAARKIYWHVVNDVSYSLMPHLTLNVQGVPESDYVLKNMCGDCGAQSMYFAAMCRAVGIPARVTGGYQLFSGMEGPHFWAEFFLPDYGWIPVDTSIAQTVDYVRDFSVSERDSFKQFYFGNQDAFRWVIQKDVDVPMVPRPGEPPVFSMVLQAPASEFHATTDAVFIKILDGWSVDVECMTR